MAKIIDRIRELESEGKTWFSLEFFPPKSETAVDNLVERVANFSRLNPVFVDITWGAGGSTAERTLELSDTFQNVVGVEVLVLTIVVAWSNSL
jgi:methylenetetrahydrofolate reductase (NADPH)